MARGRIISKSLSTSRKFAKCGEFAQVLYVLIVAHADDFGRQSGDAFTVKHQVFPVSPRSESEFLDALHELERNGLIQLYRVNDEEVLQVVGFEQHQTGLHKRSASRFPEIPGNSRNFPEIPSELKGTEGKGREGSAAALIESPLAYERKMARCAFVGSRLEVPNMLHAELRKSLGGPNADTDLQAWYADLDGEIEESGEAIAPDIFKWLRARYSRWKRVTGDDIGAQIAAWGNDE